MLPARDADLIQILDATLADATRRAEKEDGSSWLACRPGCTSCCHGMFRISMLDAERLRIGLGTLRTKEPEAAAAIECRARTIVEALGSLLPGDRVTGYLSEDEDAWNSFADLQEADAACPILDPLTGRCELYTTRPLTCRVFGPPVQNEGGLGMCELCYIGAPEADILHGEMHLCHHELEQQLDQQIPKEETVIAWALLV